MANIIKPKRSSATGAAPLTTQLEVGEIAVNMADGILYVRDHLGQVKEVGKSTDLSTCLPITGGTITGDLTVDNSFTSAGSSYLNSSVRLGSSSANAITVNGTTTFNSSTSGISYNDLDNTPNLGGYATTIQLNTKLDKTDGTATNLTLDGSITEHYKSQSNHQGTFQPNAADGSIQQYQLTGDISFSGITGDIGSAITFILKQDTTGNRLWSNFGNITCYYAGGNKSLSAAPSNRDLVSILKTGNSTYYISIANGFST